MNNKIKNNNFLVVFLAVTCGLAAGVCGEIITRVYILSDFSLPYLSQDVNLGNLNNNQSSLIIQDPKKVVVSQDLKISETISSLAPSLVSVFKEIKPQSEINLAKPDYYNLDQALFTGLIVTSDGWILSSLPEESKTSFTAKGYVVITADRKIYKIDKIAVLDNLPGDVVFFHLTAASNLPVRKIVPRAELSLGQSLLVIDNHNNAWPTSLSSFKKTPEILSSDFLNARLELANNSDAIQKNSFVFNLSGDLIAVVDAKQEIIPAFAYDSYWQSLWEKAAVVRPSLGLNYLDLSLARIPNLNLDKGALIYPGDDKIAVVKNGPAFAAGLRAGDIISWVNNQEINKYNDLADLITQYKPGDKITISYLRDNQDKQVDIKLGELK